MVHYQGTLRGVSWVLVGLLGGLALVSPVHASCSSAVTGALHVPTASKERPLAPAEGEGLVFQTVAYLQPGTRFQLGPSQPQQVGLSCRTHAPVCIPVPDFDITFHDQDGDRVGTFAREGGESGTVPFNAAYALVWMTFGPAPGDTKASFVYRQGCR